MVLSWWMVGLTTLGVLGGCEPPDYQSVAARESPAMAGLFLDARTTTPNLIAYDPFEGRTAHSIDGLDAGVGWRGAWRVHYAGHDNDIVPGNLAVRALKVSGNHIEHFAGFQGRFVDTTQFGRHAVGALVGAPGTTLWLSLVMERATPDDGLMSFRTGRLSDVPYQDDGDQQAWAAGAQASGPCADAWALFVGDPDDGHALCTRKRMSFGAPNFVVVRLTFAVDGGDVSLYIDPRPGDEAPGPADAHFVSHKSLRFRSVQPGCRGECLFDEIRLGSTFAAVAPVGAAESPR